MISTATLRIGATRPRAGQENRGNLTHYRRAVAVAGVTRRDLGSLPTTAALPIATAKASADTAKTIRGMP
jgi:hypothetical protein